MIVKAVAEVTRAAMQAMAAAMVERPQSMAGPKICGATMKQLTFNWEADDKYSKIKTFRVEVNSILTTYNTPQTEQLTMEKKWLGSKGLKFIESLTSAEKDTCSTLEGFIQNIDQQV